MTNDDIRTIKRLRENGVAFSEIAKRLSLNENTIKSYCYRNAIKPLENLPKPKEACEMCLTPIVQKEKRKKKRFCSDQCRSTWWNEQRKNKTVKRGKEKVCANCDATFHSYKDRKYCSHPCYIKQRFGRDNNE